MASNFGRHEPSRSQQSATAAGSDWVIHDERVDHPDVARPAADFRDPNSHRNPIELHILHLFSFSFSFSFPLLLLFFSN